MLEETYEKIAAKLHLPTRAMRSSPIGDRPTGHRPAHDLPDTEPPHHEEGALPGEHPGRAKNPTIKVEKLAWLEFERTDLDRAVRFAEDFGFTVHRRTPSVVQLRGARAGTPCVILRQGPIPRFLGPTFAAADASDLHRLARRAGGTVEERDGVGGGRVVRLQDPSGVNVQVVHGVDELPELGRQNSLTWNVSGQTPRRNAKQRPPRRPARVERLGHVVLASRIFGRHLNWHLQHLGLIASDFVYLEGLRERGPVGAWLRLDLGSVPSDHHTLALFLHPVEGYMHSAYEVADLDALAAGGEYLRERGWTHSFGVGRHVEGSQVFDYWRDPDRAMVEHYTDGDVFDASVPTGWGALTGSGLRQWGPRASRDFLDVGPSPAMIQNLVRTLREDNDITPATLLGMARAMRT